MDRDGEAGLSDTDVAFDATDDGFSVVFGGTTMFFGPDFEGAVKFPRGMYGKGGRLERMGRLLVRGYSMHQVMREMGGWRGTIIKLRRVLEILKGEELRCPCGKPSRHQGLCSWRIEQSDGWRDYLTNRLPKLKQEQAQRHAEAPPRRGERGRFAARL